jgi:hypothetical protein
MALLFIPVLRKAPENIHYVIKMELPLYFLKKVPGTKPVATDVFWVD